MRKLLVLLSCLATVSFLNKVNASFALPAEGIHNEVHRENSKMVKVNKFITLTNNNFAGNHEKQLTAKGWVHVSVKNNSIKNDVKEEEGLCIADFINPIPFGTEMSILLIVDILLLITLSAGLKLSRK